MVDSNHKIFGSGSSPEMADSALEVEQKGLVDKVGSDELAVVKTSYEGRFELKEGIDAASVDTTSFSSTGNSWDEVAAKHAKVKDGGQYSGTYSVHEFYALTDEQMVAIRGERRSPAGYESTRDSSLGGLESLRA